MDGRIVITASDTRSIETRLQGVAVNLAIFRAVGRPGKSHDAAVIGRDRGLIETDVTEIVAQLGMAVDRFILLEEADAVLRHKYAARLQTAGTAFVERRGEQTFSGTD